MMRRTPRSRLLFCAAVVVALVTAFVVFQDIATLHDRASSLGPPRSVLVVARDVALGATLRAADVRVTSRHASTVPENALRDLDDAVGRIVSVPLVAGATVQEPQLVAAERDGIDGLVPVGHRAVRVRTDDGLQVPAGAVVDVLAAWDPTVATRAEAEIVARAARVLEPADGAGEAAVEDDLGVTLLVTEDEARGLAYAAANGVVTLALAPPEDACCSSPGS